MLPPLELEERSALQGSDVLSLNRSPLCCQYQARVLSISGLLCLVWFILQLHCLQPVGHLQRLLASFSALSYNELNHICCCQLEYVCGKEMVICLCFAGFDEQLSFFKYMELMCQSANKHLDTECRWRGLESEVK